MDESRPLKSNLHSKKNRLRADINEELENKTRTSENRNPPTYIQNKDGTSVPISLQQYRKDKNPVNVQVEQKRKEIEALFRKNI